VTGGLLRCRPVDASTRVRESPPSYVVVVTQFVTHLMVRALERTVTDAAQRDSRLRGFSHFQSGRTPILAFHDLVVPS
jgi:hypothetical protein